MKTPFGNRNLIVSIFAVILFIYGAQGISYAQEANPTITASTPQPLTEVNLHGSVVTLTLSGRRFADEWFIGRALTISGIEGGTVSSFDVDRVSDTEVTVKLTFAGNIDTDATLTIEVGADAIIGYNQALTAQLPVTAVEETLVAATESPLTSANLHGSAVTLTLSGRRFARVSDIHKALTVSGIEGVTVAEGSWDWGVWNAGVERVSDTEAVVNLALNSDFNLNTDGTLTITVGADAILGYNEDFTFEFPVTALAVSLTAVTETVLLEESIRQGEIILTEAPLTEENLYGSAIRITLSGQQFAEEAVIKDALTFSSPDGRIIARNKGDTEVEINGEIVNIGDVDLDDIGFVFIDGIDRVRDSEVEIALGFHGDLSTDATLTLTVGADAIPGYNEDFTFTFPVTAVEESLTPSTAFLLTEENLNGYRVKLSLSGRQLWVNASLRELEEENILTISGIEGVTIEDISFTRSTWLLGFGDAIIILGFDGDFDTDATLTITVGAPMILGYSKGFTIELPVTATQQSDATVSVSPSPIALPGIGEKLTLNLDIANGENVAGYQATVSFDPAVLRYVESANADYLPADAFFIDPIRNDYDSLEDTSNVTIAGNTIAAASNGDGALATLTFEVVDYKPTTVTLAEVYLVDADGKQWEVTTQNGEVIEPPELDKKIFGDLNLDGVVNIEDLTIVKDNLGQRGQHIADVNGDHLVDIVDLVLVAGAFEGGAAAPVLHPEALEMFTTAEVQQWLSQAQHLNLTDAKSQRGILFLVQLLTVLTPKETALLVNFPNPFNPETWIPYQLAKPAEVTITIYTANGQAIQRLALGHQHAGRYHNRSRAAYWDGKNTVGEPVASGVYFYTLTAGDFTATRKMLIRK